MKKYLSIAVLLVLFVVGCSEQLSINEPVLSSNQTSEPNWVALPQPEGLIVNTLYSDTEEIDGDDGGYLRVSTGYRSRYSWYSSDRYNSDVTIYVKAYFPDHSFDGSKDITMIVDDETCTVTFSPHMVFDKPVVFNAKFTGVDLSNINTSNIRFAYIADNGTVEYAPNDGIIVDKSSGTIEVNNARIPHFSRYGFVN